MTRTLLKSSLSGLLRREIVNPFDIVEAGADGGRRELFGLITNVKQITDAPSHLSNYISSDFGSTEAPPQTPRQGANVADVNVLANYDPSGVYPMGIYMPVQSEAPVLFSDEEGIHVALGIDKMPADKRIPAGLIRMSNGTRARVYLDSRYVLGPEGAHVNIAGISGLATKTSYAMFLIQSMYADSGCKGHCRHTSKREAKRPLGYRQTSQGNETRRARHVGRARSKAAAI